MFNSELFKLPQLIDDYQRNANSADHMEVDSSGDDMVMGYLSYTEHRSVCVPLITTIGSYVDSTISSWQSCNVGCNKK